jgi:RimJ/RimL family protein N-acetyltransferase
MKESAEIRLLTEQDAIDYWKTRLRAVKEEPSAFSASYEEEVSRPIEEIINRFREHWTGPENYNLGSFSNGVLTGIVGFNREQRRKLRHKANIWGMYICPEARGKGIGRCLLTEVIRRSYNVKELEQIGLTVTCGNKPAIKLYENLGFKAYGIEKRALKIGFEYFDDILMVLPLEKNLEKNNAGVSTAGNAG